MSESIKPQRCPECRSSQIEPNHHVHLHLGHGLHRALHHHPIGAIVGMAVGFLVDHQLHKAQKEWKCTACEHKFSRAPNTCDRCTASFFNGVNYRLLCCSNYLCATCKDEIQPSSIVYCDLCGNRHVTAESATPQQQQHPSPPPEPSSTLIDTPYHRPLSAKKSQFAFVPANPPPAPIVTSRLQSTQSFSAPQISYTGAPKYEIADFEGEWRIAIDHDNLKFRELISYRSDGTFFARSEIISNSIKDTFLYSGFWRISHESLVLIIDNSTREDIIATKEEISSFIISVSSHQIELASSDGKRYFAERVADRAA